MTEWVGQMTRRDWLSQYLREPGDPVDVLGVAIELECTQERARQMLDAACAQGDARRVWLAGRVAYVGTRRRVAA